MPLQIIPVITWGGRALMAGARAGPRLIAGVGRAMGTQQGMMTLTGTAFVVEAIPPIAQEYQRLGLDRILEWEWPSIIAEAGFGAGAYVVLAYGGSIKVPLLIAVQAGRGELRHQLYNTDRKTTYFGAFVQIPTQLLGAWAIKMGGMKLFGPPTMPASLGANATANWVATPTGILLNSMRSIGQELFVRECTGIGPAGGGRSTIPAFGDACAVLTDTFEDLVEAGGAVLDRYKIPAGSRPPKHGDTFRLERLLKANNFFADQPDGIRDGRTADALNRYIQANYQGAGYRVDASLLNQWQPTTQRVYLELMVNGSLDPLPGEPGLTGNERAARARAPSQLNTIGMMNP